MYGRRELEDSVTFLSAEEIPTASSDRALRGGWGRAGGHQQSCTLKQYPFCYFHRGAAPDAFADGGTDPELPGAKAAVLRRFVLAQDLAHSKAVAVRCL